MSSRICSTFTRVLSMAVLTLSVSVGQPAEVRAEKPSCAPLLQQLQWHPSYLGMRMWWEVAPETLTYAGSACREDIARGKAPEVAAALTKLEAHSAEEGAPLRRFAYRLACNLHAPEARQQILAGVREPAVYAECADALFSMNLNDDASKKLREVYLEGLQKEPEKTHLPAGAIRPQNATALIPVLRAYDQAALPQRDALYRVVCLHGIALTPEQRTACAAATEREPLWAMDKIRRGDVAGGFAHIAALPPSELPQFGGLLQEFDANRRPGRDRLYKLLCSVYEPAAELQAVCESMRPAVEREWPFRKKEERVAAIIDNYTSTGRHVGEVMFVLALLVMAHALWSGYRNHKAEQKWRAAFENTAIAAQPSPDVAKTA